MTFPSYFLLVHHIIFIMQVNCVHEEKGDIKMHALTNELSQDQLIFPWNWWLCWPGADSQKKRGAGEAGQIRSRKSSLRETAPKLNMKVGRKPRKYSDLKERFEDYILCPLKGLIQDGWTFLDANRDLFHFLMMLSVNIFRIYVCMQ